MTVRDFRVRHPEPQGPHAFIQWKGTTACVDVYCTCGVGGHVDAEFLYSVRCSGCGKTYDLHPYIALVELTPEEATEAAGTGVVFTFGETESANAP